MSDWWGTRATTNQWGDVTEPGTGLAGFFSSPDLGAEIGDRAGVISQILMNLGGNRGGAGIAEATAAANERSDARRERRRMTTMANRMADKLETSNPELAAMIRANPRFGLELAGKQALMPIEFAQEEKLAKMRAATEYTQAVDLAKEKARLEQEKTNNWLRVAGLGDTIPQSNPAAVPVTGTPVVPNDPNTQSLGTGEGEITVSPLSETSSVEPPAPEPAPAQTAAPEIPREYLVGLPENNRALAQATLKQRLLHQDPEIGADEVSGYIMSGMAEDHPGTQKYFDNIRKRKEVQARVQEFASGANEMARQNQALPGINLQTPGQPELQQARIPLESIPTEQQPQVAEYLKQAVKEDKYGDALERFLPKKEGAGGEIVLSDGTVIRTGGGSDKPTEYQQKNDEFYTRAQKSEPILNDGPVVKALTSKVDPLKGTILPSWASAAWTSNEYKNGVIAARNFVAVLLRKDSGAQVTEDELALYWDIFIPTSGEGPQQIALKKGLRDAAVLGIKNNRSKEEVLMEAYAAKKKAEMGGNTSTNPKVDERLKAYPPAGGP